MFGIRLVPSFPARLAVPVVACAAAIAPPCAAHVIQVPLQQPTIQAGISASVPGDTVQVANGVFAGAGNRDLRFNGRAITVRSKNGPGACTIDAQFLGRGFIFDAGEPATARLEGFTITHGVHASAGGGIYINGSSPTVTNCRIVDNRTANGAPGTPNVAGGNGGNGAGLYVQNGAPTLGDCTISDNLTGNGGTGYVSQSGPGGSPGGNGGAGAGIYVGTSASVTLLRCIIASNTTGAGGAGGSSVTCVPPLACLTFGQDGGDGGDGGGLFTVSGVQAINCMFASNATGGGGAAGFGVALPLPSPGEGGDGAAWCGGDASCAVTQCTLVANNAAPAGGAGQPAGIAGGILGTPAVVNSILWNNNSTQVPPAASVTYSLVQGGHSGTGNLASDPHFVAGGTGNYRLQSDSPCIDAGDNNAVPSTLKFDLDAHKRIRDGNGDSVARVDQGVYEYVDPTDTQSLPPGSTYLWIPELASNQAIRLRYRLAATAIAHLDVFAVDGRRLARLGGMRQDAGEHVVLWDRRDAHGARLARGIYFVVLDDGRVHWTRRVVLTAP
jgi:hypothetical protein